MSGSFLITVTVKDSASPVQTATASLALTVAAGEKQFECELGEASRGDREPCL